MVLYLFAFLFYVDNKFSFYHFFFCFCCMVGKSKGIEKTQGFTKGGGSQTSGSNDSIICNILVVLVLFWLLMLLFHVLLSLSV